MIVRAKRYGAAQDNSDMDLFEIDEDMENLTKALPELGERAPTSRSRYGLAPILEADEDYEDFDTSEFLARSYQ